LTANMLKAIYDRAVGDKSDGSVYDRVGGRIYCPAAPEKVRLPYVVFINMTTPRSELYGATHHEMQGRFVVYTLDTRDGTAAASIIDAVKARFAAGAVLTVTDGTTVALRPGAVIGPEKIAGYMQAAMDFEFVVEE